MGPSILSRWESSGPSWAVEKNYFEFFETSMISLPKVQARSPSARQGKASGRGTVSRNQRAGGKRGVPCKPRALSAQTCGGPHGSQRECGPDTGPDCREGARMLHPPSPSTYLSGEFLPIACQCRGVSYGSEVSEGLGLPLGVLWADGAKIHGCKHHPSPTGQVLRHGPWGPKGSLPHHPALDSWTWHFLSSSYTPRPPSFLGTCHFFSPLLPKPLCSQGDQMSWLACSLGLCLHPCVNTMVPLSFSECPGLDDKLQSLRTSLQNPCARPLSRQNPADPESCPNLNPNCQQPENSIPSPRVQRSLSAAQLQTAASPGLFTSRLGQGTLLSGQVARWHLKAQRKEIPHQNSLSPKGFPASTPSTFLSPFVPTINPLF